MGPKSRTTFQTAETQVLEQIVHRPVSIRVKNGFGAFFTDRHVASSTWLGIKSNKATLCPYFGKPINAYGAIPSTNIYYRQFSFIGEKLLYDLFSAEEF